MPIKELIAQTGSVETIISYKCLNKPLPVVLKELSIKSNANIVFSDSKFKSKKTITINANNEKLGDILKVILDPYRLTIEIIEGVIVVVNAKNEEIFKEYILNGVIRDKTTGELLPYASVFLDDKSQGIYSNEKGFYAFKLKRGTYKVMFSYCGYDLDSLNFFIKRDSSINISLNPSTINLEEIIVQEDLNKTSYRYGEDFYSKEKIYKASSLLGESDVMRSIITSAGVTSGADGFGGLSVRGGNNDQNFVLYDGVPVQNTGHAFGLISIFSSSVIKDARLIKSAFPARYGGRLSSYLDVKTRDGNNTKFGGEVGISTIASHVTIEGPIAKDKASFLFSYRRTFADPTIKSVSEYINQTNGSEGTTSYYFQDFNGKISFDISKKNQLSLSFYKGVDDFNTSSIAKKTSSKINYVDQNDNNFKWGNNLISFHWNAQIGKNQYSKLILFQSNWNNNFFKFRRNAIDSLSEINDIYTADLKASEIKVRGVKWDYDLQLKPSNIIRLGVGYNQNSSSIKYKNLSNLNNPPIYPEVIDKSSLLALATPYIYSTNEVYGYLEEELSSGKNLVFNIGIHTSIYKFDSTYLPSIQPRMSLALNGDYTWFNISGSLMRQYQQSLSENGLGFPSDLWVNASRFIKPADGYNFSTQFGFLMGKNASLNFGGFYKLMNNIISIGEGRNLVIEPNTAWQKDIPFGKGKAYGAEVTFKSETKLLNFELNFTYSKSTRQFEDLNNALEYLYKFDRKYMSNAIVGVKIGHKLDLIFTGTYQEGAKVTFPSGGIIVAKQPGGSVIYPLYTSKNNYTFKDYIRLDVAFNFVSKSKAGTHRVFAGVYNVLNRKNPIYLQLDRNTFNLNTYEANQVSILPLLPAISYSLTF
jgi:hypothetical protein